MNNQEAKFKELQGRSQKINESAIKINTQIETSQQEYARLSDIALKKYGTSDLDELKKLAENWEAENQNKIQEFETSVNNLEKEVNEKSALIRGAQ